MLEEWIHAYLRSLKPALVIKRERYVTKQGVKVFNEWFILGDGRFGMFSVIHDDVSLLGTMLPRQAAGQIGEAEPREFDLSRYLLLSERKEDLLVEKRFNKRSLEKSIEDMLTDGAERLCGLNFFEYVIQSVCVVTHFWRIAIWDSGGLVKIVDVDVFHPSVKDASLPIGLRIKLEDALGGVLHGKS